MSDQRYRDSVPVTLFICAVTMVLGAFVVCMMLLVSNRQETLENREVGKVNQTYTRATNCFAAHNPNERNDQLREACYEKAEKATGVKVDRYGDGR